MPRKIFISGIDRLLAQRARAEAQRAKTRQLPWEHGGHVITAIILAVAAFEAHVGEWLARPRNGAMFNAEELDRIRWQPGYEALKTILKKRRGAPSNMGQTQWYRQLRGLYELRNHVAHYSPEKRDTGTFPARLHPFITERIFAPAGDDSMDWTSRLLVGRIARKAVSIARHATTEFNRAVRGWPLDGA